MSYTDTRSIARGLLPKNITGAGPIPASPMVYIAGGKQIKTTAKKQNKTRVHTLVVVVYLTLTDPRPIQLCSQDRGSQTKKQRERTLSKKKQTNRISGRGSSLQRALSPGRDSEEKAKKQKTHKIKRNHKGPSHLIRIRQEKHHPQQAKQERQPYK